MSESQIVLSFDVDWAPDFMIEAVAHSLIALGVRSTWFITHDSPALALLRAHPDLFELGIHPNFLPHSTQGGNPEEVLQHCIGIVPEAISVRTHQLVQSTVHLAYLMDLTKIRRDVSLYIPIKQSVEPFEYLWRGQTLLRMPYNWGDDFNLECSPADWDLLSQCQQRPGVTILCFHPVHVYLNSATWGPYLELRSRRVRLSYLVPEEASRFVNRSTPGSGTALRTLATWLSHNGGGKRICDVTPGAAA